MKDGPFYKRRMEAAKKLKECRDALAQAETSLTEAAKGFMLPGVVGKMKSGIPVRLVNWNSSLGAHCEMVVAPGKRHYMPHADFIEAFIRAVEEEDKE